MCLFWFLFFLFDSCWFTKVMQTFPFCHVGIVEASSEIENKQNGNKNKTSMIWHHLYIKKC